MTFKPLDPSAFFTGPIRGAFVSVGDSLGLKTTRWGATTPDKRTRTLERCFDRDVVTSRVTFRVFPYFEIPHAFSLRENDTNERSIAKKEYCPGEKPARKEVGMRLAGNFPLTLLKTMYFLNQASQTESVRSWGRMPYRRTEVCKGRQLLESCLSLDVNAYLLKVNLYSWWDYLVFMWMSLLIELLRLPTSNTPYRTTIADDTE